MNYLQSSPLVVPGRPFPHISNLSLNLTGAVRGVRSTFRSGILAPHGRLGKRWKRL